MFILTGSPSLKWKSKNYLVSVLQLNIPPGLYAQGPLLIIYDQKKNKTLPAFNKEPHSELYHVTQVGRQLHYLKTLDDTQADGLWYNKENLRVVIFTPISIVVH